MRATEDGVLIAGRYELGPLLRRGGMADVHDGTDRRLQRAVAIKLLRPDMAHRRDVRLRFEAEARAAARLAHPNAVAVFDTGEHDGTPYIVMERLSDRSLVDVIGDGPVDPEWLLPTAAAVLSALGAAHAAGIVHRDVKPGNILLTADGSAKIADFGIAKSAELASGVAPGTVDLTGTGQLVGTLAYLAPERLAGAPATFLSDIYSMGVVLYEALAGEKPFAGESFVAVAQAVQQGQHPSLMSVRPGLDPTVAAAVERAMDLDPSRRFASAEEMAEALVASPIPPATVTVAPALAADPAEATTVLAVEDETPTEVSAAGPLPLSPVRRRFPLAVPLAAAGALLVGLLVLLGMSNDPSTAPRTRTTAPLLTAPTTIASPLPPQTTPSTTPTNVTRRAPRPGKGGHGGKGD